MVGSGLPFRFVGCMRRLGEFLCSGGQAFLGPLQILLQKLDASVQGGDLALSLKHKSFLSRSSNVILYAFVESTLWLIARYLFFMLANDKFDFSRKVCSFHSSYSAVLVITQKTLSILLKSGYEGSDIWSKGDSFDNVIESSL